MNRTLFSVIRAMVQARSIRLEGSRYDRAGRGFLAAGCLFLVVAEQRLVATSLTAPYPPSPVIRNIEFDFSTIRTEAPFSDNWAITWADDGNQYTVWGDGGGFGGNQTDGRVTLGVARVEGDKDNYVGYNVWGGKDPENEATFGGKSYGIISIQGTLWMWRSGETSDAAIYDFQELYFSNDHGATWNLTNVQYDQDDFTDSHGFFAPTFLQFGQDYQGARDTYVYMYASEIHDNVNWEVQYPGEISMIRVRKQFISDPSQYAYFAGLDGDNFPTWTVDVDEREPVFEDPENGTMRVSVSYNEGLDRYFLITQQVSRNEDENGHIGIYDAPEPWGPWTTVLFENAWDVGLQQGFKDVYWNFSNKWLSADGRDFTMVYTGPSHDAWGTVEGHFVLEGDPLPLLNADFDEDGDVDLDDFSILSANYGRKFGAGHSSGDANGDGAVDMDDYAILALTINGTIPLESTPEPATWALLGLGAVLMSRRRRR